MSTSTMPIPAMTRAAERAATAPATVSVPVPVRVPAADRTTNVTVGLDDPFAQTRRHFARLAAIGTAAFLVTWAITVLAA